MDGNSSVWLELAKMTPFWIRMNTRLTNANITLDNLLEWQKTVAIIGHLQDQCLADGDDFCQC